MSVPSEQFSIKFQGDGKTGAVFPITFGFTALASVVVRTLPTTGDPVTKVLNVDYTITPTFTGGTGVPITDGHAEGGWVNWIGASPTDVIEIVREEAMKQTADLSQEMNNINSKTFEKSMDKISMALSGVLKRDGNTPDTYDAGNRVISNVGDPIIYDDLITRGHVGDLSDATKNLLIPDPSSVAADKYISPSTLLPSTPYITWESINQLPTIIGRPVNAMISDGTSGAHGWESMNWIPEALHAEGVNIIHSDGNSNITWKRVYEVPLDRDGDTDDVATKKLQEYLDWRNIPRELPQSTLTDTTDNSTKFQFLQYNIYGQEFSEPLGPRITYGTIPFDVTIPSYTVKPTYHCGGGSGSEPSFNPVQFSVPHGMVDDDGDDEAPAIVFLTVENPKYGSGAALSVPFFVARLNDINSDETNFDPGITSFHFNGQCQYLNVNDNLDKHNDPDPIINGVTNWNLPLTSYKFQVNWIAFSLTQVTTPQASA